MQASIAVSRDPSVRYLLRIGDTCLIQAQRLAGDAGELGIARAEQPLPQQLQEGREHEVAQHGDREVTAR